MDTIGISPFRVKVYKEAEKRGDWSSAAQVALATEIAQRTCRHHLSALVKAGLVEEMRMFPCHLYRIKPPATAAEQLALSLIRAAADALGYAPEGTAANGKTSPNRSRR